MNKSPKKLTLAGWDIHYAALKREGIIEPAYGGPLSRHVAAGDLRLPKLRYDNSAASLDLWNFLLSEEDRLHQARADGKKIIGAMKDLGTVPVMAFSLPNMVAFYPDGAWWIPCVMELSDQSLCTADSLGIDDSFCPVRAMLGAYVNGDHFPLPDLSICSVGATCDDFSAIAQRLEGLGHPVFWWEMPCRRAPAVGEIAVTLPGGFVAPAEQVGFVRMELERVTKILEQTAGLALDDDKLRAGIEFANKVRSALARLRRLVFTAKICPLPALELLIAEMLAIHFCSDRGECLKVLRGLLAEVERRVAAGKGFSNGEPARIFWINPVADLQVMNLLEESGGRLCGTEYLFSHALDEIPTDVSPMEALARIALADPMAGSVRDRASRICRDMAEFGSEAAVICRIPGASHCALEGTVISDRIHSELGFPVVEIEVPPLADSLRPSLSTRLEALVETVKEHRKK